jgi:Cys-rich repeat protein
MRAVRVKRQIVLVLSGLACSSTPPGPPCISDSQCPSGDYCDFSTVTACSDGSVVSTISEGNCRQDCGTSCEGASCKTGDDCGETSICEQKISAGGVNELTPCTIQNPCSSGTCTVTPCPGLPACPAGCGAQNVPHSCTTVCECPGNICTVPGGTDAG